MTKLTLDTSTIAGLKQRISHRLDKKAHLLNSTEFEFLFEMDEWLCTRTWITKKRLDWLLDILERTEGKRLKEFAK